MPAPVAPAVTSSSSPLTYGQLEGVWIQGGGDPAVAPIAAAISLAESSGIPNNVQKGQPYTTTGWGLWQITPGNSVPSVGVDNQLLNPVTNAQAAVAKYKAAGGFGPWTTYTSGAYRQYLQSGVPATTSGATPSPPGQASTTGGSNDCLIKLSLPGVSSLPFIGGAFSTCVFTKGEARALLGGVLMAAGGFTVAVGVLSVAAGLGHGQSQSRLTRLGSQTFLQSQRGREQRKTIQARAAARQGDADDALYEHYRNDPTRKGQGARAKKAFAGTSVSADELAVLPALA